MPDEEGTVAVAEDTAVETASEQPEVTPPETSEEVTAPETTPEAAPESAPAFSLSDVPDDDLFEDPRFKARLASETESIRRKTQQTERERAARAALDDNNVIQAITRARSEDGELDTKQLAQILGSVKAAADWQSVSSLNQITWGSFPDSVQVTKANMDRVQTALEDVQAGRISLDEYAEISFRTAVESYVESVEGPKLRAKIEKEVRKEMSAKQETARLQAADQQGRNSEQPTDVKGGAGAAGPSSLAEAEDAYIEGKLSHSEYKKFRERAGLEVVR